MYIIPDYPGSCERTHTQEVLYFQTEKVLGFNEPEGTHLVPDEMRAAALVNSVHESQLFHRGPKASGDQWSNAYYRDFQLCTTQVFYMHSYISTLCKKNAIPRILFIDDTEHREDTKS